MKKCLLFTFTLLVYIAGAFTQEQITWNAKAGLNISNWTSGDHTKTKIGYRIGGGMDYEFAGNWSLQPSLYFTTKGTQISEENLERSVNQMYVELPVMVAYRFYVAEYTYIVISAGPYLAYGVGGKTSINIPDIPEEKITTFGDFGVKRFDTGFGIGAAVELGQLVFSVDGQLGFVKAINYGTDSPKNLNISVTLGYLF